MLLIRKLSNCAIVVISMFLSIGLHAQTDIDEDVSFIVLGKSPLYWQDLQGNVKIKNYYLFGEIFLKNGGKVTNGKLHLPKGSKHDSMPFMSSGDTAWKVERQDFDTLQDLYKAYPDGDYIFEYVTGHGKQYKQTVQLKQNSGKFEFPKPASIYFYQQGKLITQDKVDPQYDLVVRWSPFSSGKQDPNKISDDLVFVISSHCSGEPFARTALPFEDIPALTYADREFRIPADRLSKGTVYKLLVEHADLVNTTVNKSGIIGFATYPSVTKTQFITKGGKVSTSKLRECQ